MSVILMACKKKDIANRDMSQKRKIIRKAGYLLDKDERNAKTTTGWEIEIDGKTSKISFSRDICQVCINDEPVETTAYISDQGYDVDLYFDIDNCKGHIFSDVDNDRDEMVNYLLVNGQCVAECCQRAHPAK